MRVLVLTNMYPPHHLGGYELSCRDVVERWRARGHDVTVLTTTMRLKDVADPPDERSRGVQRGLDMYWKDHRIVAPSLKRRLAIERANQQTLHATLDATRPEVVSAWNMGAMSLGLLTTIIERAIPLVLNVCDGWLWYGPRVDAWCRLFVRRPRLARFVRRHVGVPTGLPDLGGHATFCFISDAIRRWSEERSAWKPLVSTVVYSGIDRNDFPPNEVAATERPWRRHVLYAGRLDERKGVHVALESLALLPDATTLEILPPLGSGAAGYEARLRGLVHQLGLDARVRFDVVNRAELRHRYQNADAVLFPTLWEEPFGLVPVEAMACGTPVIATGTGGSAEFLIDGVNCVRVPPGDASAIADALQRLSSDSALRARVVDGGLRTAADLDVGRLAETLEAWHVATAERFARGRPPDRKLVVV